MAQVNANYPNQGEPATLKRIEYKKLGIKR
jgi:hypothetical protein